VCHVGHCLRSGTFVPLLLVVSLPALHIHVRLVLYKLTKSKIEELIRPVLLVASSERPKKSSSTALNIMTANFSSTLINVNSSCTVLFVLTCTVVVLTCFVMCGCFGNTNTCIYCVLYCLY